MIDGAKINGLIKICLTSLSDRQKEILEGRYGISGLPMLTLAELGHKYGLTRERIRQIEALGIKGAKDSASGNGFGDFIKTVSLQLKNSGGIKREDLLVENLGGAARSNQVKFLLEMSKRFHYSKDSANFYPYWYLSEANQKNAMSFVSYVLKNSEQGNFAAVFDTAAKKFGLADTVASNYASVSKRIAQNVFGEFGLSSRPEINPKTARDWAYLVLKKEKRPLHFNEIASLVSNLRQKEAHAPTIHNELIKDERFVLVGKGTYTLGEFGVVPGTAKEIIGHFLKKHGPMKSNDIVKTVLKQRLFKENTILINLQNRKNFKRLGDGRYTTLV